MPATYTVKPLLSDSPLSKSKYVHGMRCPMYLWLETRTNAPKAEPADFARSLMQAGNKVGALARCRYDERLRQTGRSIGVCLPEDPELHEVAVEQTLALLNARANAIYEAAFTFGGVKARVDALVRLDDGAWELNEVKSTSDYDRKRHLYDLAVQLWVLRGSVVQVERVNLVHIDNGYEWPGGEYDLDLLFADRDATDEVSQMLESTEVEVGRLLRVVSSDEPPVVPDNVSCHAPHECPYFEACPARPASVEHPIDELQGCQPGRGVHKHLTELGFTSLLEIDEATARREMVTGKSLNQRFYCTWKAATGMEPIVLPAAADWMERLRYPIYHLDFETLPSPLPVVPHSRPFEQVPLQYSLHIEQEDGAIEHREFLVQAEDPDPRLSLIENLLRDLGTTGTVLQYHGNEDGGFESLCLKGLRERYPEYANPIEDVRSRIEDLGYLVKSHVFHPDFHGKWSIKKVYPALIAGASSEDIRDDNETPLGYDDLDGVAQGGDAAMALLEYMSDGTTSERREAIRSELLEYCELDTWAMVEVLRAIRVIPVTALG